MRSNLLQTILSKLDFEYQERKKQIELKISDAARFCVNEVLIIDYKTRTDRPQNVYLKLPKSIKNTTAGIYILWENEDIVYVGQSIHLEWRILSHLRNPKSNKKNATHFAILPTEKKSLNQSERELIKILKPRYNVQHK